MSVEIEEFSKILYDANCMSKIGIELEVLEEDGSVSVTALTDLHEFLLNLLVIGIHTLELVPTSTNLEIVYTTLQHYFNKINIQLMFTPCTPTLSIDDIRYIYCKIYFANDENNIPKLHVIKTSSAHAPVQYTQLQDIISLYILQSNSTTGIRIQFKFMVL